MKPTSTRLGTDSLPSTFDGASALTIYLFLLLAIPSQLVIAPLGGAGTPALLTGVGCALWWLWERLHQATPSFGGVRPVRLGAGIFTVSLAISYVMAMMRPINAGEQSTGTLGLLAVTSWTGVLLLGNDGIPDQKRLDVLLGRIAMAGGALATLGVVQFITHQALTDHIAIPGLSMNQTIYGAQSREGFTRPSGTAIHPIEFGAVLSMILPVAMTRPLRGTSRLLIRRWYPTLVILLAVSISSSRSALVSTAVGMLVLIPSWTRQMRRMSYVLFGVLASAVFVFIPGMLGTIVGLFSGVGTDSSSRSRFDSYGVAWGYFERSPLFGRGLSTFLPTYRIFDNEYLLLLVEVGVIGLLAVLVLLSCGLVAGTKARRLAADPEVGYAAQGLVASIAAGASSLALFDAFSFPMVPGILFLMLGVTGSILRLAKASGTRPALGLDAAARSSD